MNWMVATESSRLNVEHTKSRNWHFKFETWHSTNICMDVFGASIGNIVARKNWVTVLCGCAFPLSAKHLKLEPTCEWVSLYCLFRYGNRGSTQAQTPNFSMGMTADAPCTDWAHMALMIEIVGMGVTLMAGSPSRDVNSSPVHHTSMYSRFLLDLISHLPQTWRYVYTHAVTQSVTLFVTWDTCHHVIMWTVAVGVKVPLSYPQVHAYIYI